MPFVTPATLRDYDVIVVGSGAAGGQTAYTLSMSGARVLMLEAGRNYVPEHETPMFQTRGEALLRGASTPDKPFGFHDATVDGGWQVPGEPYVNTTQEDSGRFDWWRARMLGGRTNHWGRYSFRNGPYDFKPRSRDGLGFDWPLTYEDLAPYYDKVEMLIGVYGANDGLENTPNSSPGCPPPPPRPRVSDLLIAQQAKKVGIPVVAGHRAVLTQPLDHTNIPARLHPGNPDAQQIIAEHMRTRAACFWATPCGRGCSIRATYQSTTVHLPPAWPQAGSISWSTPWCARSRSTRRARERCQLRRQAHWPAPPRCRSYGRTRCQCVRNGAHTSQLEELTVRRRIGQFQRQGGPIPHGHGGQQRRRTDPLLESLLPHNEDGASGGHMYAPWWLYEEQPAGKLGFPRGYHIEFGGGRTCRASPRARALSGSPVAATAAGSRKRCGATTARSSTSTVAAR